MIQLYRVQDIQLDDVSLKQQYYNLFFGGDVVGAQAIVSANPQLVTKVLTSDRLNNIVDGILTLENKYKTDFTDYLADGLVRRQFAIDELVYMTLFNLTVQYEINNFVLYNDDLYYCHTKPPIGTMPTDVAYWLYLGLKGEDGNKSLGVNYKGSWNSTIQYVLYDMVVYNNELYVSKTTNINQNPSTETDDWFLAVEIGTRGIYVSYAGSQLAQTSDLWMEIPNMGLAFIDEAQTIRVNPTNPLVGLRQYWIESTFSTTQNSALYISATQPSVTLNSGDIWLEVPTWSFGLSDTVKAIYIAPYCPANLNVGEIWINLLYD